MSSDQQQFFKDRERQNLEKREHQPHGTLETYRLEKQNASNMFGLPSMVINGLAVIGGLAVIYVILSVIF